MIFGRSFKKKYSQVAGDNPFPELELVISNSFLKNKVAINNFMLDTGADSTCIDHNIFDDLDIEYHRSLIVQFGNGENEELDTCLIDLEIPQINFKQKRLEVVILPRGTVNLLGRDVLNKIYLLLSGPKGTFKIKYR